MRPRRSLPQLALALLLATPIATALITIAPFPLTAIAQAQTSEDRKAEADQLLQQGIQQLQTNQFEAALQSWQQALQIYRETKDYKGNALMGLGVAYKNLSQYDKAIALYEQALSIFQQLNDRQGEAKALGNLGNACRNLSQYDNAIAYYQQALPIFVQVKDRNSKANALMNLGIAYGALSQYEKAIAYFQQALPIFQQVKDRNGEGNLFSNLGFLLKKQQQLELAIVFYKQCVNVLESIRKDTRSLSWELQASYTQSVASSYRNLASLLLKQNRVMEALQVLDLLKVQELQDYLRDIKGNQLTAQGLPLLPQEREIVKAFNQNPAIAQTATNPTVRSQVQQLQQTAAAQNLTLPAYKDLQARIQKLGKNIALFYPLILDDRVELVLFIPGRPPIHQPVSVTRAELERSIQAFRQTLEEPDQIKKTKLAAQQLYTWLFQPLEAELKAANVQTIVYAPDGQMRYIPLAAFYDGNQWLIERYQINYLTALALTPLNSPSTQPPRVLAAASTREHTVTVAGNTYCLKWIGLKMNGTEISKNLCPDPRLLRRSRGSTAS